MVWACLLSLIPEGCEDAWKCIYHECAKEICPLFCGCFIDYLNNLNRRLGRNEDQENTGQPQGQTESQANNSQPGNQTERQANSGQGNAGKPGGQTGSQANAGPSEGQANAAQSSSECLMIFARDIEIEHSEKKECWEWVKYPSDPRFKETLMLKYVYWLEITAKIYFSKVLSPKTKYGAYLIFNTTQNSTKLDNIQNASVTVGEVVKWSKDVCIKPTEEMRAHNKSIILPAAERDGWMKLMVGKFYYNDDDPNDEEEAKISIKETNTAAGNKKIGLIVAGIEIRPI